MCLTVKCNRYLFLYTYHCVDAVLEFKLHIYCTYIWVTSWNVYYTFMGDSACFWENILVCPSVKSQSHASPMHLQLHMEHVPAMFVRVCLCYPISNEEEQLAALEHWNKCTSFSYLKQWLVTCMHPYHSCSHFPATFKCLDRWSSANNCGSYKTAT